MNPAQRRCVPLGRRSQAAHTDEARALTLTHLLVFLSVLLTGLAGLSPPSRGGERSLVERGAPTTQKRTERRGQARRSGIDVFAIAAAGERSSASDTSASAPNLLQLPFPLTGDALGTWYAHGRDLGLPGSPYLARAPPTAGRLSPYFA